MLAQPLLVPPAEAAVASGPEHGTQRARSSGVVEAAEGEGILTTLDATSPDQPAVLEPPPASASPQPHARWPYQWLATGLIAIAASFFWPPLGTRPALVLLGQDQRVWSWIIAVSGGIAIGAGLLGIAHSLGRNHDAWWQEALLTLFSCGVVVALCIASLPALVFAALTFGDSYRDLGNTHGDGVVVALHPSNGYDDSTITFGTRHGIWVDFDPTTQRIVARDATLHDWTFALRTTATTVQVRSTPTTGPRTTDVVTLPRTTAAAVAARPANRITVEHAF